ncbi:MAG: hypothetical protein KF724_08405 [Phycisphaeraceae bacterium]|nr:hypothetical protein [Phycisphaeraceae bacterium]
MKNSTQARSGRRWLRWVVGVAVVLVILVALAPTLISMTIGRRIVTGLVRDQVNGDVSVTRVRFGWTAPQKIDGLTISDRANGNEIFAVVAVNRSLLSLMTDPMGELDVEALVAVTTSQAPDGTLGLASLVKTPPPSATTPSTPPKPVPPATPSGTTPAPALPSGLVVRLTIDPSSFIIDQGSEGSIALSDFRGSVRFAAADGSVQADLNGRLGSLKPGASPTGGAAALGPAGPMAIKADLKGVLDSSGAPTVGAMKGTASVSMKETALRYDGQTSSLRSFDLSLDARDASGAVAVAFAVDGATREQIEVGELAGRLTLGRDPSGPMGISASQVAAAIERGRVAIKGGDEPFSAEGIVANFAIGTGGRATFAVAAETTMGSGRGSVSGEGSLENLFNDDLAMTLGKAVGSARLSVERAVTPVGPLMLTVDTSRVVLDAPRADAPLSLAVDLSGRVSTPGGAADTPDSPTSLMVRAQLARDPASATGISTDPRSMTAEVQARGIPSASLRPFLTETGPVVIDPVRDIGPVVNLTASAKGGSDAPIEVNLSTERVKADLSVVVDPASGSLRDGRGTVEVTAAPELLAPLGVRATAPVPATISITSLGLPRRDEQWQLNDAVIDASIAVKGAITLPAGDETTIGLSQIATTIKSAGLARGATIAASAAVDGVMSRVDAELGGLAGIGGSKFDAASVSAKGTLAVGPIDWSRAPAVLHAVSEQIRSLGLGLAQSTLGVGFDGSMKLGAAQIRLADGAQGVTSRVDWNAERVRVDQTTVNATLTDALLDGIGLKDFRVATPAPVVIAVDPMEVPRAALEAGQVTLPEVHLTLKSTNIALVKAPGVEQPVSLLSLDSKVALDLGNDVGAKVSGTTALKESAAAGGQAGAAPQASGPIANVDFGFDGSALATPGRKWNATVNSKDLEASRLLRVAGVDPATVPGVAPGDRGTLALATGTEPAGALGLQFDTAVGAMRGAGKASLAADGSIALPTADLSITMDAAKSTEFFSQEKDPRGRTMITRASAVPITLSLRDTVVPAPLSDGTRPWAKAKSTVTLTTGNLDLDIAGLGTTRLGAVDGKVTLAGNGRSLVTAIKSTLTTPQTGAHPLSVAATMTDFTDTKGAFDWVRLALQGNVQMQGFPVALLDVFMDGDGSLVEAIGPQLDVDVRAVSPSGNPGSVLTGNLKSEFLVADLGRVAIQDNAFQIAQSNPFTAALIPNPTLRERILRPINPVLADIRPQEGKPLVFTISRLDLPTSFDLREFDSRFSLVVGDVELQRGGSILNLLQLVREDDDGIIPGNISPLDVTVNKGNLSYENFILSMGKIGQTWNQQIFLSGDVDIGSTPMFANAINVDYPIVGVGRLASGATRFDAFFGRVNQVLGNLPLVDVNAIRVRATFSGPIEEGRHLEMAFEPVIVMPPGSNPVDQVLDGLFGDRGILRIPGRNDAPQGSGGQGGGTPPADKPSDPIRGIFDDIFKRRNR